MPLKHNFLIILIFFLFCGSFGVKGQEVKLGLPVGHSGGVNSANYSQNGKLILTASDDETARVWDAQSGKLLRTLFGHSGTVENANFSPDGAYIVTASSDKTACIWDVQTGNLLHKLLGHNGSINSANFSPDGKFILTASIDNTARIWDVQKGSLLHTLVHSEDVDIANFSPDGAFITTASRDKSASIWDAQNGKLLRILKGHEKKIKDLKFSPNGKLILTASEDGTTCIWDTQNGNLIHTLRSHGGSVNSANFSPDGIFIVTASADSTSCIWDLQSGDLLHTLIGHTGRDMNVNFSPNGKLIVTASTDNTVRIWDVQTGKLLNTLKGHWTTVDAANFSQDGAFIVSASNDRTARIWDVKTGKLLHTLDRHAISVVAANFSPDGKFIVSASQWDKTARIWGVQKGNLINTLKGHTDFVLNANFNPDGRLIVTASEDNTARIWDAQSGNLLHTLKGHSERVVNANFSSSGRFVVTVSWDQTARIWDAESGKLLHILEGHPGRVINANFSQDERFVVTSSWDKSARIWDLQSGNLLHTLEHTNSLQNADFSQDGKFIVSLDGLINKWEVQTGKLLQRSGNGSLSDNANFSQDGMLIVTGSDDGSTQIWNSQSGSLFQKLEKQTSSVNSANFSQDGLLILGASHDGSIIIWNSQTGEQLIRHFIFDSDPNKWLHLHPSGLFDASPEAMELMYWTKGLEVIEFTQLKDRYWVPGLWEKVMKGEALPDARNMNELKLQPEVEMGEVIDGKIPVTITKRDGGYGNVEVLINGKEIKADARGSNFDSTKVTQIIYIDLKDHPNLLNGENTIAVKASSEDGFVTGRPEEKKLTMSLSKPKPHFYAVVVGTGKYMNSSINLKFPEKDASSISTSLQLGSEQLFGKENTHIYTLTTADAERPTKEKIKSVFSEISKTATSSDVILVYLSGHGISWGGEQNDFYYVTTDATAANSEAYNDEVIRKNTTISTAEFTEYLNAIPALKQVMIIDACASGKAVDNLMAARDIDVSQIKAIDRMKDRTGMFVISGSAADAVSYEASRYGQGLLTYSILQAMKGAALRDGQFFDVNMILNYARESVPKLAAGIGGIQTPQLLAPKGGSFDIGQVNEESKKKIPLSTIKPVFVRTAVFDDNSDDDDLNLSKLLDEQLSEIAMRGTNAQLVFLDTREFPDGFRLRGSYTQNNGTIILNLKIKGPKESEHTLSAKTKEELVEKVLEIVEGLE